jgi:hypothetical protein
VCEMKLQLRCTLPDFESRHRKHQSSGVRRLENGQHIE